MNEPTEEQIKKFWEWCGLRYEPDQDEFKVIYPDGEWDNFGHNWEMDEIEPPIDLNNLFLWAVPKFPLCSLDYIRKPFSTDIPPDVWFATVSTLKGGNDMENCYHKDPALALFWAIYKVMEAA